MKTEPRPATPASVRLARATSFLLHLFWIWFGARFYLPLLDERSQRRITIRWAKRTLRIFNVKLSLRGRAPGHSNPMLVVANHVSWLDMYVLNAIAGFRFVAKSEVARWPLIGTVAKQLGALFHVRGNFRDAMHVKNLLADSLKAGSVAFFPEGTTTDGTKLSFFYPALFQAAVDAGAAVQPVAIRYRDVFGAVTTAPAYCDDISLAKSISTILSHTALTAEIIFCEPMPAVYATRTVLADCARASIAQTLQINDLPRRPRQGFSTPRSPKRSRAKTMRPDLRPA